jgi:CheY-like chemotaxis protein
LFTIKFNMKRILLAEDEENIADFVSRGLESFGYEVDSVRRGDEAWQRLAGSGRTTIWRCSTSACPA